MEYHVVEGLGEQSVEGEFPVVSEDLLVAEVYPEHLGIFELLVDGVDGGEGALSLGRKP